MNKRFNHFVLGLIFWIHAPIVFAQVDINVYKNKDDIYQLDEALEIKEADFFETNQTQLGLSENDNFVTKSIEKDELNITNTRSQNKNNISINVGEKYLSDWIGRYGLEYGITYSHFWRKHISSSISTNLYNYHKADLMLPPQGYVQRKSYFEINLGVGYFIMPENTEFIIHSEIGFNYRARTEEIVVASGITAGGWAEVIAYAYDEKDLGLSITNCVNYIILKRLTIGLFGQFIFYPTKTYIIYPEGISHESPNTISYGLSFGFNF